MAIAVREMALTETDLAIDYFHGATPEHLEMIGVDPSRLPTPEAWRERFQQDLSQPLEKRRGYLVIWPRHSQWPRHPQWLRRPRIPTISGGWTGWWVGSE